VSTSRVVHLHFVLVSLLNCVCKSKKCIESELPTDIRYFVPCFLGSFPRIITTTTQRIVAKFGFSGLREEWPLLI
jgi:hypothetical protein